MNPTTQPSEGAVRAARRIFPTANGLRQLEIARIIDAEMGLAEITDALAELLAVHDLDAFRTRKVMSCDTPLASKAIQRARTALSRHTSTQGKEGKL